MININLDEAITILKPLAIFILGVVVYSVFIFKFYRFLARKDIIRLDFGKYNTVNAGFFRRFIDAVFYVIEYVLLFPIFTFFWFCIFAVLLAFLAKDPIVENILLVSMAVVGAIRITAYYTEELSKDLAKMLPFALLGVFLIDISYFSVSSSIEILKLIPEKWTILLYYLAFIIVLEFVLRILHGIFGKKEIMTEEIN